MSHPSRPAIPAERPVPRVLVGAVMTVKSQTVMELGKVVAEEVQAAGFKLVRSVVVNGDGEFIQQLVSNVSNDNEADAIILVGGTGIGPKDTTCEAVESVIERGIEGFGDEFRHMLRHDLGFGAHSWLARASAGVYNQCLVFAMTGRVQDIRRAMVSILVPTLSDGVELATGRMRHVHLKA
ncbi:MAG TPA: molybdopterin-binding protein [Polyangiaceae bacterium]